MSSALWEQTCVPCRGDAQPLTADDLDRCRRELPQWTVIVEEGVRKLTRTYRFRNFRQALAFTNRIGELAEENNHHPRLCTEWGSVTVTWWTHSINGLHWNDCIMAARTDRVHVTD